ncbi:D-alanyl-D-alanine carboxypeptidase/D-alanyl-D-alanine endopeptidase [Thaumasiovibrio subtropicus]|uniref:D-alanyl-D-alanine carboxypeptidase/D-alanyl-D-alanine endopeptidase n=1 Tax=Thaumasiovibrio subtropicus TaxID=1891207 RepID=UPI00131C30A2|nr:D-alanyl-D-alanine carboxypeptidase/D-alanyl-D-alanine-endopeptidase [Thaumasiovibrio subtropicus]
MNRLTRTLTFAIAGFSALLPIQAKELPTLPGANVALHIQDLKTGEVFNSYSSDQWMQPASTQKVLTALVAKQRLGTDFRYTTSIHQDQRGAVINFSGDPTLNRTQLSSLLKQARSQQRNLFDGDIYLVSNTFVGENRAVGIPWDTLGVCYAAPATGIALDKNCIQGSIYSNRDVGEPARVHVPAHHLISVDNQVTVVSKEQQQQTQCEMRLQAFANNHYLLTGCLVQRDQPLPLRFALQDPKTYIADVIRAELKKQGVNVKGTIYTSDKPATSAALSTHHSPSLMPLLAMVLQDSNNILTDSLLRHIGAKDGSGSFSFGTEVMRQHLAALLNDEQWLTTPLNDGSGLSRNNRLTTQQLAQVITYITQHEPELLALFPVSGESGTLRYRRSLRGDTLKGKVQAKTGSLYGASNLAGIVTTSSGRELLVVQLVNDYFWKWQPRTTSPLQQFERALYTELVTEY